MRKPFYFLSCVGIAAIFVAMIAIPASSCKNPYVNPNTSKAITEKEQLEVMKQNNADVEAQTVQLKRIADALDRLKK